MVSAALLTFSIVRSAGLNLVLAERELPKEEAETEAVVAVVLHDPLQKTLRRLHHLLVLLDEIAVIAKDIHKVQAAQAEGDLQEERVEGDLQISLIWRAFLETRRASTWLNGCCALFTINLVPF